MKRSVRFKLRNIDHQRAKAHNAPLKAKERARRDARMAAKVKAGSLPHTPDVMSWLSAKLGMKSSRITEADVRSFLS